jgi:hypothetical protein
VLAVIARDHPIKLSYLIASLNKHMSRLTLTFLFSISVIIVFGQKKYSGIYQTNFPAYGMFGETLTLNCDSTVALNFRGDLMNDTSFGYWTVNGKILTLTFDSILHPKQRYKGQINYMIKRNRFYQITITKKKYQELKEKADQDSLQNHTDLKLSSYKEFKKKYGTTMKNSSGKTGVQYFKKIKSTDCKENNR